MTPMQLLMECRRRGIELSVNDDKLRVVAKKGTMTELLDELEDHASEKMRNAKTWPGSARSLSNRLRRSSTALRQVGIEVEYCRDKHKRTVRIAPLDNACKVASPSSPSSPSEKTAQPSGKTDDANDDASMFGNGVCVTDDARVTQDDATVTQANSVASPQKWLNKAVSEGDDANDDDDARIQGLSKSEVAEAQSEPLLILDAPRRPASWLDHDPYL